MKTWIMGFIRVEILSGKCIKMQGAGEIKDLKEQQNLN